jgi:hypothetical protein
MGAIIAFIIWVGIGFAIGGFLGALTAASIYLLLSAILLAMILLT